MALASQRAEHERQLEAALAARDAEALEALRLLDARHRRSSVNATTASTAESGSTWPSSAVPATSNSTATAEETTSATVPKNDAGFVVQPVGGKDAKRDRRRRPRPVGEQPLSSPGGSAVEATATVIRRSAKTAAAIRSAAAARDAALRDAKEESDRLEDALSSPGGCWSERSSTSPVSTAEGSVAADDGGGGLGAGSSGKRCCTYIVQYYRWETCVAPPLAPPSPCPFLSCYPTDFFLCFFLFVLFLSWFCNASTTNMIRGRVKKTNHGR